MPLLPEQIVSLGFIAQPQPAIGGLFMLDLGRDRYLMITGPGTSNEMMYLTAITDDVTTDMVCIHNFDYDGFITQGRINSLVHAITGKEIVS